MFYQPSCDWNNMPKKDPFTFGFGRGPYSVSRNCFVKQDLSSMSLEYMYKFWKTYPEDRKYFTARIISAHEFSGENSRFLDPVLAEWLEKFDSEGLLDDTIVNLYSDHGDHIDFLMWKTKSGYSELMNPFMFIMVPDHIADEHHQNLEAN
jgi:membrane-anchored protein YejM (alkaline phosphatase superfamily)